MNPNIGDKFRFTDLVNGNPSTELESANEFTVISVEADFVSLKQKGFENEEPTRFSRANFEANFEPLP